MTATASPLQNPDLASAVRARPRTLLVFASLVGTVVYLIFTPPVPDLAAQVARADIVRRVGLTVWWQGWFGGVHLPTYSALSPMLMAALGPPLAGAIAAAAAAVAMSRLLRSSQRPLAGTIAFLVTDSANLVNGRITFAIGLALGLWCLVAMLEAPSRWREPTTLALGVLTSLASPLAGAFLGLAAVTIVLASRPRDRRAVRLAAVLAATLLGTAVLFPGSGQMPFGLLDALPAAACALGILAFCRDRRLQVGAVAYLLVLAALLVYPAAVGMNITRLAWIFALPLVVAHATLPRRSLVLAAAAVALIPALDLGGQLVAATDASAHESFYQPLLTSLAADQAARPQTLGQRVEVVDTRNHWASAYLTNHQTLARGWERQADRANNPLFYTGTALNPAAYRAWLDTLAVGWVAVPNAPLDYASVTEAALIATRPSYLRPIWSNRDWTLYRVVNARPLADGATVLQMDDRGLTLAVHSLTVLLAVRWSPYLVVTDPAGRAVLGCVSQRVGWVEVTVPTPGTYRVVADFDGRLRGDQAGCQPTAGAG
jgi:hypothetical protein